LRPSQDESALSLATLRVSQREAQGNFFLLKRFCEKDRGAKSVFGDPLAAVACGSMYTFSSEQSSISALIAA
jgi:hypothetical protein